MENGCIKNLTDGDREASISNNTSYKYDSVHLSYWPKIEADVIDPDLEEAMELAQSVSSLVHSIRKKHKLKVRQPLSKVLIPALNEKTDRQINQVASIILSEVNVKEVHAINDNDGFFHKKAKPNFKLLGKKFGKDMQKVGELIKKWENAEISELEKEGKFLLTDNGVTLGEIVPEEVEIYTEDVPGWLVASENGLTVALDITVTDALRLEGIARDFVNRVQNLRKDSGFEVTDKIRITLQNNDELLASAVTANREYICQEVQALDLSLVSDLNGSANEIEMDEFLLKVKIEVVS